MPNGNTDRLQRRTLAEVLTKYKWATTASYTVSMLIVVRFAGLDDIKVVFQHPCELEVYLRVTLFFLIFIMGGFWVESGIREMTMSEYWLAETPFTPPDDIRIVATIFGIGFIIAALALFARRMMIFAPVYAFYIIFDILWWLFRLKQYRCAIPRTREFIEGSNIKKRKIPLEGIAEVETYYLKRPHIRRCIILLVPVVLITLALYNCFGRRFLPNVTFTAYIVFIVLIIVGEIPILVWRIRRDQRLDAIREKLGSPEMIILPGRYPL